MPIQSLGIFDSVFDWVCDKIFNPIISWLSKILNSIFEWILDTIVIPLLLPVFEFLWNIVIANIADIFFTFIYNGFCQFLWLLDQLQSGFDVLIGLKDITYYSEATGQDTQTTLLQYFMNNDIIRNAMISITFIALGLSIIFAIYSVMRSTLDFDFEGKRPVGKVLNSVAKTMIAFLLVPTICIFGVSLVSIVLKQTCSAISGGSDASLGRWVLAISSIDAGRGNPPVDFMNQKTSQINEPWYSLLYEGMDYITFGAKIHVSHIDYLIGYAAIIFMMIVMIACLFTFIKRIFDIIILYITSPYFVSTIVLDDGEKFRKWRESFIARILVGFGSVIGMRIFLMMVPVIMNDNVKIFDSFAGNITGGYVIRLVFILGGMFAVYKSSTLLTGIISSSVAAEENMNNALLGGMVAGGMMKGAKAMAGAGISAFSKMRSKSKETVSESKGKSSKFTGGTSNTAGKGKFPQSNKPRQKNYLSDKEYDDTLASVDELFRTGTLGTDYQAEKDYEDTLSSVDELFRTGTLGTDYQAEKDYEDTLSSVDELFKTGTLGSAYQDEENAYEGVRNLFGEEGGDSFNDGSSTDYSAQDIVKNVDPLEAAKNTTGGSSSGTSSSSGGSAQFTGDSAANVVKTVDPLETVKNTTSGSSGGSAQFTGDSAGSSASSRSAESKQSSNLDDPLLHRKNDHKNDSGKF
ncbi:MAG: hypothetical protein MSR67_10465 [Oscillospiraceae bacterium]|nr:hypothetical protein [Oscillospiraceae bacterium]